jgi:hypothetical protein
MRYNEDLLMIFALFRRTRRASSAALAAVFTAAAMLVCLPLPAAADTGHCAAARSMSQKEPGHCDPPRPAMDCCVDGQQSPSVPAAPQDTARLDAGTSVMVPHVAAVPQHPVSTHQSALRVAPLHGHRHIDLPTLNASFLI